MTIALIFIIVIILLYVASFIWDKFKNIFVNTATLLQTVGALWAIWYAIDINKSNNEQFTTQLENQKTQIKQQENIIKKQDSATGLTLNALYSIADTSGKLVRNFENINSLISRMPNKIDKVANSFEELNKYTEQQTNLQKSEFEREANIDILEIICENEIERNTYHIKGFNLFNSGNIDGVLYYIKVFIPQNVIFENTIYNTEGRPIQDLEIVDSSFVIILPFSTTIQQKFPGSVKCHFKFIYTTEYVNLKYEIESYSKYKGKKIITGNKWIFCQTVR